MEGVDFSDNSLWFTYEWEDETSQFDPKGRWCPGGEYYSRTYKMRVPKALEGNDELSYYFVEMIMNQYEGCDEGFWVE
jgi:hypothetical protein